MYNMCICFVHWGSLGKLGFDALVEYNLEIGRDILKGHMYLC
jgi:hypothetical protein